MYFPNEVKAELNLGEMSEELIQYAKENINEDPATKCQVVSDFRDMIFARGECTPHRTDDEYLLKFLRCRNFVIERAHRLICNYYDFKEDNPEFFEGVNLSKLFKMGEHDILSVPPYRDQLGRRLLLYRIGNWDPELFTPVNIFQATLLILELAILEPQFQIVGGVCIFDLGGLTMQQVFYMSPSIAHKVIQIMVTCFPVNLKAVHIVNQPWIFDIVYNIFKPFIDERMKERIFFHGDDMESLHKHIDPKHLPERYGGLHPDYNYNDWIEGFKKNEFIQKELVSLGYQTENIEETNEEV
ncbi:clavesin-2-like [Aethina tumida]|uniref:clavesin-2-like n=1 Tax=Aethina tumida TaxID=116153 RepID=UPI0021484667|nr:clavesin-2-like [Aethina tumida]XP_049821831.1 clavesin-2-like [Aethina tumida]